MNCAGVEFSTDVVGGSPGPRGAGMRGISPRLHLTCAGASAVSAFLCFQLLAVVEREVSQRGDLAPVVYEVGPELLGAFSDGGHDGYGPFGDSTDAGHGGTPHAVLEDARAVISLGGMAVAPCGRLRSGECQFTRWSRCAALPRQGRDFPPRR